MRLAALMAVFSGMAFGWGAEGHRLVARIAEAQLTPAARSQVAAILGPQATMASISSWADEVRRARPETGPWHYIDIPITAPHLDMARDCPKSDCVLVKIADFRKLVADPATPPEARREALMFLIHFIGDMHQPLHCSDHHDRGGNDVHVDFFNSPSNLHSVWDSGLIGRMRGEDELLAELVSEALKHAHKWSKGTVEDWAEQAHKSGQKVVYGRLPKSAPGAVVVLGTTYERSAVPLVKSQIEKAGDRLARILNQALP